MGPGRVVQPGVVEVDGTRVGYRDLVLNTGSTPLVPEVPGLDAVPTWTSEQAMSTSEQPRSVAVIGGGPVGCELAYLFAVLGTRVTVIQRNARLIPREEPEASASMADASVPSVSGWCSATRWRRRSPVRVAPGWPWPVAVESTPTG